jgi:cytochrome P450
VILAVFDVELSLTAHPSGHETTSTATSLCLLALSQNLEVQSRLRAELLQAFPLHLTARSTPKFGEIMELASEIDSQLMPSVEDLNSLTYLDAVVREALRFHPPIETTYRVAMKDDVIPLHKPFTRLDGQVRDHIESVCNFFLVFSLFILKHQR